MKIPLNAFESYIDEVILKRGLYYFKSGYVNNPEEISPGKFEAIVRGTENYTVHVEINKGVITDYDCDCPYDMGPVCKHIVGVIFSLQQEELGLKKSSAKEKSSKPQQKRKTVNEKVSELLKKLSSEDLKKFISEQCEKDSAFRRTFLFEFAHLNEEESIGFYKKQIKAILNSVLGKYDFVSWSGARFINKNVNEILSKAKTHLDGNNYTSTIYMLIAMLEEMTKALQIVDDSNGDVGSIITIAVEMLFEIAKSDIPEDVRKFLIEYCFSSYEKEIFSGWDWHIGMLEIASKLLKTKSEEKRIFELIDGIKVSEFSEETLQTLKYEIILKTKGDKEADKYIKDNLKYYTFRNIAIAKFVKANEYEKAVELAKEGIKLDSKSKPGLVNDWSEWLLKISVLKKEKEKIVEYSKTLFIDSYQNKDEYYKLMKNNIEPEKWNEFVSLLIEEIKKGKRFDFEDLAYIYVKEEMWKNLLDLLKSQSSVHYLEHYERYLNKDYPEKLAEIYEKNIKEYLKRYADREHYKSICRFIRRMKKLGVKERVETLIEDIRKTYNRRPALLEELSKI